MTNPFNKSFRFVILLTGASGIIAQIILIRELMVSFYGNEFSIGLVLANWLILEALGSFLLGKTIERTKNKLFLFNIFVMIFSFALPVMIYLTRIIKNIIGAAPGEIINIPTMFIASFLILLPLSITHGALFTFSCNLFSIYTRDEKSIGKVYVLETIGTIIGGIALPFLLIPYFSSFAISFGLGLVNFVVLFLLILAVNLKSWLSYVSIFLIILFSSLIIGKIPQRIHNSSINQQWRNHNVVYYKNSIYGNITVIKQQEQYTFFEDGIPVINTPVPDIAFAEDFVHFPLLSHPNPKSVLVISGAAGGILTEILKHPVEEVDYVELDPLLLKAIEKFPTPITNEELSDPRVKLIHEDARFYLRDENKYYDIILVNLLSPSTLQINRLFTKEFFSLARTRLKDDGILTNISFGSLSYLSEELKKIIKSNLLTLKLIFPYVEVIPGDFNLYLASASTIVEVTPEILIERLNERKIKTNLFTPDYISYRLSDYRMSWFWDALEEGYRAASSSNSDLSPRGVFYTLSYWNSLASAGFRKIFDTFQTVKVSHFILIFILLLIIGIVRVGHNRLRQMYQNQKIFIPFALFSTGFAGMVLNLVIVLAFQSIHGYVFHQISLLITAFIVGTAIGGFIITRYSEKLAKGISAFLLAEVLLILMAIIIPFILSTKGLTSGLIFPILSIMVGSLVGFEFPLANKIYSSLKLDLRAASSSAVGWLYASDLAGGFFGAILISAILIPVLGIFTTCLIALISKVTSILLILFGQMINVRKTDKLRV